MVVPCRGYHGVQIMRRHNIIKNSRRILLTAVAILLTACSCGGQVMDDKETGLASGDAVIGEFDMKEEKVLLKVNGQRVL